MFYPPVQIILLGNLLFLLQMHGTVVIHCFDYCVFNLPISRIHGLKSGKCLKEFRGHTSFVTSAIYTEEETHVVSSCSDGTIKVWSCKSTECQNTFRVSAGAILNIPVNSIHLVPKTGENQLFVVCNRTSTIHVVNIQGQVSP